MNPVTSPKTPQPISLALVRSVGRWGSDQVTQGKASFAAFLHGTIGKRDSYDFITGCRHEVRLATKHTQAQPICWPAGSQSEAVDHTDSPDFKSNADLVSTSDENAIVSHTRQIMHPHSVLFGELFLAGEQIYGKQTI